MERERRELGVFDKGQFKYTLSQCTRVFGLCYSFYQQSRITDQIDAQIAPGRLCVCVCVCLTLILDLHSLNLVLNTTHTLTFFAMNISLAGATAATSLTPNVPASVQTLHKHPREHTPMHILCAYCTYAQLLRSWPRGQSPSLLFLPLALWIFLFIFIQLFEVVITLRVSFDALMNGLFFMWRTGKWKLWFSVSFNFLCVPLTSSSSHLHWHLLLSFHQSLHIYI